MDEDQVWAIISPRGAIHVARLEHRPLLGDKLDGPTVAWVEFPCLGGPARAMSDLAMCTDSDDEMKNVSDRIGSRGMYCIKEHCEGERQRFNKESEVAKMLDQEGTTVNNSYYDDDCGLAEFWQVLVTICVVTFIVVVGGLIWHAIDMSRASNVAHQKTLQVKYQTCAHDDNPRYCLQKVQE